MKCNCGLCKEEAQKGGGYAKGHYSVNWYQNRYIELYGDPICKYCGKPSGFHRKTPKKYCSKKCSGLDVGGFTKNETQSKIKKVVKEKYGVDNVSFLDVVKQKIGDKNRGKTFRMPPEVLERLIPIHTKINKDPKRRKNQRVKMLKNWETQEHRDKVITGLLKNFKNRLSGLHLKVRTELNLVEFGFISEQKIDRYIVDELNEKHKLIIEINGDYVHANPKLYEPTDIISLPGNSCMASEKWESARIKKENLEKLGYTVLYVWESDNLIEIRKIINEELRYVNKKII